MKNFIVLVLCVMTSGTEAQSIEPPTVTGVDAEEIQPLIDAIYHPSTDPLTAAALEQMLLEVLGINNPVIIEEPIKIVNNSIIIEPEQNDEYNEGLKIVDEPYIPQTNYRPPLEQIILNAKFNSEDNSKPKTEKSKEAEFDKSEIPEQAAEPEAKEETTHDKSEIPEKVIVTPIFVVDNPDN